MRTAAAAAAAAAVFAAAACRPGSPSVASSAADSSAVIAADEQYRQSWLTSDTALAFDVLSSDVIMSLPAAPDIRGEDAVRRAIAQEMGTYKIPKLDIHRRELVVRGDHAIDIGTYEETLVPKTGKTVEGAGRYMTIWRREGGHWKIWRFMINFPEPEGTGRAR